MSQMPLFEAQESTLRSTVVNLKTPQEVESLLRAIRNALRKSLRSGGLYGVYRRGPEGCSFLAINIHVPAAAEKPKTRTETP